MLQDKDRIIAQLKAAMWEDGDVERLISKAIRAYVDQELAAMQPKDAVEIYVHNRYVAVNDVPHVMEEGVMYENLLVMTELENALEQMYSNESVPTQLNFDDLLS